LRFSFHFCTTFETNFYTFFLLFPFLTVNVKSFDICDFWAVLELFFSFKCHTVGLPQAQHSPFFLDADYSRAFYSCGLSQGVLFVRFAINLSANFLLFVRAASIKLGESCRLLSNWVNRAIKKSGNVRCREKSNITSTYTPPYCTPPCRRRNTRGGAICQGYKYIMLISFSTTA